MFRKLRPVGARIPYPRPAAQEPFPWASHYQTEFTGSGTEALSLAVAIAIERKKGVVGPEVIIPAYGCPDLVSAILAQGARPVLVDLKPETPYLDRDLVEGAISDQTVAIVGVGFLGITERLAALSELCRQHNLMLIEDSAQCFPPLSASTPLADCVVLSFGRGKPINLMGGGAILFRKELGTSPSDVLDRYPFAILEINFLWLLKRALFNLLMSRFPFYVLEKLPFLAIGKTQFHRLETISRLRMPADMITAGLKDIGERSLLHRMYERELGTLRERGWIDLGRAVLGPESPLTRLRFALLAPSSELRDRAYDVLNKAGIGASCFYSAALPSIAGVGLGELEGTFPAAEDFASRLLTLPCHDDVRPSDIATVRRLLEDLQVGPFREGARNLG